MVCKNCNTDFRDNYCSNCGQKKFEKLKIKTILTDFFSIFNIEKGIILTFKELFIQPQKLLQNYIKGKRIRYQNPLGFIFISLFIYTFIAVKITKALEEEVMHSVLQKDFWNILIIIFIIPIYSILTFLFFKSYKLSFSEHFIINIYIQGEYYLILSILLLLPLIFDQFFLVPYILIISFLYLIRSFILVFNKNKGKTFLISIFIYIIITLLTQIPIFFLK